MTDRDARTPACPTCGGNVADRRTIHRSEHPMYGPGKNGVLFVCLDTFHKPDTRTPQQVAEEEAREAQMAIDDVRCSVSPDAHGTTGKYLVHAAIDRALKAARWAQAREIFDVLVAELCSLAHSAAVTRRDGFYFNEVSMVCDRLRREYEEASK